MEACWTNDNHCASNVSHTDADAKASLQEHAATTQKASAAAYASAAGHSLCRLKQLQAQVCEAGCLQQLHQPVHLHQHLSAHCQAAEAVDDVARVVVRLSQQAQPQQRTCGYTPQCLDQLWGHQVAQNAPVMLVL
jgi:hypothetical protein